MDWRLKASLSCYLLFVLIALPFVFIYLFRPEFMPHHAAALGQQWVDISPVLQTIFLGLMKAASGAWLSVCIAMSVLIAIAFSQRQRWAFWAIPAIAIPAYVTDLYAITKLVVATPADPPWEITAVKGVLLLAGIILSVIPAKKAKSNVAT
jgi:hypothetical protein